MSKVYKHSGTFGDLIYSLFAVERMGGGTIAIALNNIEKCVSEYAYKPEEVDEAHRGRFTQTDYDLLEPLLKAQPYINDVVVWDGTHDVDLDKFRGVLFRGFEGNYVQAMCITHKLDFVMSDYDHTWLIAASNKVHLLWLIVPCAIGIYNVVMLCGKRCITMVKWEKTLSSWVPKVNTKILLT